MPLSKKRSVTYLLLIACALLFAYSLRFVFHPMTENSLLAIAMMTARWTVQVTLTVMWCISIRRRILNTAIRKMLLSVGGLLLFWQIARIIKYDYVIVTGPIGRYCWYSYYIPMVLVPLIGVFVVDHIGKPEGYRSPVWMRYLFIPALFLLGVVFTNGLIPFIVVNVLFFAFYFISTPLMQNRAAVLGAGPQSNLVMGSVQAVKSFGSIFGSALAGFLYEWSPKTPFVFGFTAFALAAVMTVLMAKAEKQANQL